MIHFRFLYGALIEFPGHHIRETLQAEAKAPRPTDIVPAVPGTGLRLVPGTAGIAAAINLDNFEILCYISNKP